MEQLPEIPVAADNLREAKEVEFYSASVLAWYSTRLEHDKSLLALSAGALGVLITLLTTVGVSSAEGLVLYIVAILAFLICVAMVLMILNGNSSHIEAVVKGTAPLADPWLRKLDNGAIIAFAGGVLFSSAIGISAAISAYSAKAKTMTDQNRPENAKAQLRESFNGATLLKPASSDLGKSFNGAANLQPSASQTGVAPTGPAPAAPTAATSTPPAAPAASAGSPASGSAKK